MILLALALVFAGIVLADAVVRWVARVWFKGPRN
jgi:hypothetical protein